jgi:hypothetical protein
MHDKGLELPMAFTQVFSTGVCKKNSHTYNVGVHFKIGAFIPSNLLKKCTSRTLKSQPVLSLARFLSKKQLGSSRKSTS